MGKLIRLRESIFTGPDIPVQIVNDKDLPTGLRERTAQELTIETQLQKLWEDTKFRETFPNKELFDKVSSNILRESAATIKKTYKFPIGRYDNLNNNKRVYPRKLWENVIARQRDSWCGLCGLADHPAEDNDPGQWKYSTIVWLDMQVGDNGIVYGIGRFVGPYGELAEDIISAGGRVGFSSSGFGDVDKTTHVVDPETYIMERVADVVLNPSQNVYGEQTNETDKPNLEYNRMGESGPSNKLNQAYSFLKESQPQSQIIKSKLGDNKMTVDATKTADAGQTQVREAATAPVADTSVTSSLTKAEEKAFRKYVESFMADASDIKNPSKRLKEMAEILTMFNDGVAGDLREKFEEKLIQERNDLEKLIESAVALNENFGTEDLDQLKENAEKIATQGVLLNENVSDYKILVEGLTERNRKLIKDNKALEIKLRIRENRLDKTEKTKSQIKVGSDTQISALLEEMKDLENNDRALQERVKKLSESNKKLEHDNGLLVTRLKETKQAAAKLQIDQKRKLTENAVMTDKTKELEENVKTYEQMIARLQEKNRRLMGEKETLQQEFEAYKTKIKEETDVSAHIQPAYKERVSGMLNFRENNGVGIEQYWSDQLAKYGEAIMPFERQIRGAKTLREATSAFMRNRQLIDADFGAAENARITEGYIPVSKRAQILQESGMEIEDNRDLEDVNAEFLQRAKAFNMH